MEKKKACYQMMSEEKNRDYLAKVRFEQPPYYMHFLESWTTNRKEEDE